MNLSGSTQLGTEQAKYLESVITEALREARQASGSAPAVLRAMTLLSGIRNKNALNFAELAKTLFLLIPLCESSAHVLKGILHTIAEDAFYC